MNDLRYSSGVFVEKAGRVARASIAGVSRPLPNQRVSGLDTGSLRLALLDHLENDGGML